MFCISNGTYSLVFLNHALIPDVKSKIEKANPISILLVLFVNIIMVYALAALF
jgi:hypothetical protein